MDGFLVTQASVPWWWLFCVIQKWPNSYRYVNYGIRPFKAVTKDHERLYFYRSLVLLQASHISICAFKRVVRYI